MGGLLSGSSQFYGWSLGFRVPGLVKKAFVFCSQKLIISITMLLSRRTKSRDLPSNTLDYSCLGVGN